MNKAEIRAKAEEIRHLARTELSMMHALDSIEAALIQVWNERGEADDQAVGELPHQQYYALVHKAIRRLRIEDEEKGE